jgi:Fe-S-cluster containining protein
MEFRDMGDGFVALKAKPCPLYVFKTCLVYEHRPYNCRRFACMRPDPKTEPFEADGGNLMARVKTSRVARRMAQTFQRRAQRWAVKHGWKV